MAPLKDKFCTKGLYKNILISLLIQSIILTLLPQHYDFFLHKNRFLRELNLFSRTLNPSLRNLTHSRTALKPWEKQWKY